MKRPLALTATSFLMTVLSLGFASAAFAGQKTHPPTHVPKTTAAAKPTSQKTGPAPFITRIEQNPRLMSRLQPLLPAGLTVENAATGFKNEGQFIAALHVSQNLKIPFAQLKSEMIGTDHDSLGKAIHDLRPNVDAKSAAKTGKQEARADMRATQPAKTGKDKETDKDRVTDKDKDGR